MNEECKNKYPIIHPVKETLNQLVNDGVTDVTLVASKYSMTSSYLLNMFTEKHIKVSIPTVEDQQWLDTFRQKVYSGDETTVDATYFAEYISKLDKTAKVVIACTELSLKLQAKSLSTNELGIYDMTRIQIGRYFH